MSSSVVRRVVAPFAGLMGAMVLVAAWTAVAGATDVSPWAGGSSWMSVRAGYAKSTALGAADGNVGYGFSFTRFRNERWAYGATVEVNVLGRYADASQIEAPFTAEISRHYRWNTPLRPFLALGLGAYYQKVSGTGDDHASLVPGGYLGSGFHVPVSPRGLVGLDVRMNVVDNKFDDNPVFGGAVTVGESQSTAVHWGVKLNYAWVY